MSSDFRLETRAVHVGMEGLKEAGLHVPPIDLSTTNPLPSVEVGGASYEQLAGGGDPLPGQSSVYQRLWQPGVARFEDGLAALEGADGAVAGWLDRDGCPAQPDPIVEGACRQDVVAGDPAHRLLRA